MKDLLMSLAGWQRELLKDCLKSDEDRKREDAIEWAKVHVGMPDYDEAAQHILNLAGLGETMEAQEWDPKKHKLMGVDGPHGELIMLDLDPRADIYVMTTEGHSVGIAAPADLTPNGKRYEITEINTDADVEPIDQLNLGDITGRTIDEPSRYLADAPEGTVVEIEDKLPWVLGGFQHWWCGYVSKSHNALLEDVAEADAKGERVAILRWGKGERGKGPAL